MRIKIFLMLTLILTMSSFISAENDYIGTVKQFGCISLYNYCPTCSYINVTAMKYPNGTIVDMNLAMTKSNNNYNRTFCGTDQIGEYFYTTSGDKTGIVAEEVIEFGVTPSGFDMSVGFYIILFILSIGIIILGYYVEDAWVVVLGSFGLVLVGLFILFYGIAGLKDTVYTWGLGIITLMLGAYFGIKGSLEKLDM